MNLYRVVSRVLLTGLAMMALPLPAHAAKQYLVEMIAFTQPAGVAQSAEEWQPVEEPLDPALLSRAMVVADEMQRLGAGAAPDQALPAPTDSGFADMARRISANGSRQILLWRSWIQPVLAPSATPVARLTERLDIHSEPAADNGGRASYGFSLSPAGTTNQQPAAPLPRIDGIAMFAVDNYYTLELDLRYTPSPREPDLAAPGEDLPQSYRIHEKRRMKSGEPNYYDHPQFGVLLLVTPVGDGNNADATRQVNG